MGTIFRDVIDDIRVVFRSMKRTPGFVFIAVLVLALGFSITGVVFSTVNGWLSVARAVPNADRLVAIARAENGIADPGGFFRETEYTRLFERRLRTVTNLFATRPDPVVLSFDDISVNARMESVTGDYFRAIGVPPLLGRTLGPDDDSPGNGLPVVLGERVWRRLFGEDPHVIGRPIRVSGLFGTIVGVMPARVRGFTVPSSTVVDIWTPVAGVRSLLAPSGHVFYGQVFGRLAEGVPFREAEAEVRVAGSRLDADHAKIGAALFPIERGVMPTRVRLGLQVAGTGLVALSSLVLLIACANLANLLLARSASRSSEAAIRMALGASPSRIVRLQLVETGCVTALGGAAGFLLVTWVSRFVGDFTLSVNGTSTGAGSLVVDSWLLALFFVLVALAAVAIGILPALRAIHIDPSEVLGSSGSRGGATGRFERNRTLLVASQVAASTVLLVVAGLFVQSALHASNYSVAFDVRHLALGHFDFSGQRWDEGQGLARQDRLLTVTRSMPGVRFAAVSTALPAGGGGEMAAIEAEDANLGKAEYGPPCRCMSVSPGFFGVLSQLRLRGRDFLDADRQGEGGVAIVNETAASLLWPGREPIGRRLRIRKGELLEVVGVVPETDRTTQDASERCSVFVPMAQRYSPNFLIVVAGTGPASSLLRPLTTTVAREAPDVSMFDVTTAETHLNRAGTASRSVALALLVLGAIGLTIAVVGLYGVTSYVVGLRRSEFGVRKVLGATDRQIYLLVFGEACRMLLIGVGAGLPIAYAVSVPVSRALVGVTSHDALTYLVVPVCLILVGLFGAWWPARRAARVQPAVALRDLQSRRVRRP